MAELVSEDARALGGDGDAIGDKMTSSPWVESCAASVDKVWQDVDEVANDKCFPSLALEKISSVPPYDRCFMY